MKHSVLPSLLFTVLLSLNPFHQQAQSAYWSAVAESSIPLEGKRQIIPQRYLTLRLQDEAFKTLLFRAPLEGGKEQLEIELPLPDGSMQRFAVVESPILPEPLASQYPELRTFSLKGLDEPRAVGKVDWGAFGFHAMVRSPRGDFFIDPYCVSNTRDYLVYYTSDFIKDPSQVLPELGPEIQNESHPAPGSQGQYKSSAEPPAICIGQNLKTYRLAVACTGEYAVASTGLAAPTVSQTLSKIVTSVNRVDGVYETDLAIRLVLVPTQTAITFTNAATDPFNGNNNAVTLIGESQNVITNTIGTANFDIGHTFSTGGGGLAGLGVVCNNSQKARGITGSPNPVGDPYDIDYVAHEIGHQFRGNHTFNANTSSCNGNRNASTAVEPGSGVTIMAYAGICGSNDLAPNSIAYFHAISYDEIINFAHSGSGANCAQSSTTGNNPPQVAPGSVIYVPKGTPFFLTGSASDPDGDSLTYSWEQTDVAASSGNWNSGNKPYFRSYNPETTPTRYFPKQSVVLSGNFTGTKGEYLTSTPQVLNFRFSVRDNKMGGGGLCYSNYTVNIDQNGPFAVLYPSATGIYWLSASQQTVTWDVNGTDFIPFNCDSVRVSISLNGGQTYSVLLASTPNDGSEVIQAPAVNSTTTTCRIKVEAKGQYFYDISNNNFTIGTDPIPVSLAENLQESFEMWPNPAREEINLRSYIRPSADAFYILRDVLGRELRRVEASAAGEETLQFSLEGLDKGLYILEYSQGKQKSSKRFIKE